MLKVLKVFPFKVNSRAINNKKKSGERDLIYNSPKYHQNISKGIRVMEHTMFPI